MATRAGMRRRTARTDWRAVLRRALRRSSELAGAVALFAAMIFLAKVKDPAAMLKKLEKAGVERQMGLED